MRARDQRRHAAQRLLLTQTGPQRALQALVLDRELRGDRLRVDRVLAHAVILPRIRSAAKPRGERWLRPVATRVRAEQLRNACTMLTPLPASPPDERRPRGLPLPRRLF